MDLFSQTIGVPFEEIEGFDTSVGGSPTNIAIGTSRLGLNSMVLTAVGDDNVGKFVLAYLQKEKVRTDCIPIKAGNRTGLAIVAVQPPDRFPLVFYRQDPADIHLTLDDAVATPIDETRLLSISGTAMSRGSCREVTLYMAEQASVSGITTFIDLDFRPDEWKHPLDYGLNMRSLLPWVDVVIGTEEEVIAALGSEPDNVMRKESITQAQREEMMTKVQLQLENRHGPGTWVIKKGPGGVSIYTRQDSTLNVPGFDVEVVNTVGAGDSFASGLIYGYLKGWDWFRSARFANACGAITVTRHGCSKALPYKQEVLRFMEEREGVETTGKGGRHHV